MRGAVRSLLRAAVGAGAGVPHRRGIRTGLGIQCGAFQGRRRRRPSIASGCVCAIVCLLRPGLAQRTNESQNVAQRTSSLLVFIGGCGRQQLSVACTASLKGRRRTVGRIITEATS